MIISQPPGKKVDTDDERRSVLLDEDKRHELDATVSTIHGKQKERIVEQEARNAGYRYIDLHKFPLTDSALVLIDRETSGAHQVASFYATSEQIRVGSVDPAQPELANIISALEKRHRAEVVLYQISDESLQHALEKYDAIPKKLSSHNEGFELTAEQLKAQAEKVNSLRDLKDTIGKTPVTEVLALIVGSAIKSGASDIHIETEADDVKIRFRVDGVLHDIGILPKDSWKQMVNRIKLIANLKLNVMDKPQDGRFTIYIDPDKVEVRTSTVPTSYGESVVMRLLRFSVEALMFDKLGLSGYTAATLAQEMKKPNGMIVATGPTGSGKTTTLYAILHQLNSTETKILTLEDPIEYKLKGINQTQINAQQGLDFASGLRSLLRQDPDIIMVGEIRDLETADTSINAALTGHLMLSTLHTNSAAGAIPRFLAMGSKNYLLAPSINAIIGQRLVRRLCDNCKKKDEVDPAIMERIMTALKPLQKRTDLGVELDLSHSETFSFSTATGCDQCNHLGYRGRIGIFEILTMNKDLEKIILGENLSEYEIQETAEQHGMVSMLQDGIIKCLQGTTSLSEVFRVAG